MEPLRIKYKDSVIAYYRFGSGPGTAFCFHGYGEDATIYHFLSNYAGDQYTFYSIDLPFHGKTDWRDGIFNPNDLCQIIEEILLQNNHKLKTSLIGFSLGGRIALSLYEAISDKIEKVILLAPDGLKLNRWYWLATQTWLGNKFFAFTMKRPSWFFVMLKGLNKINLVNSSIFKFVNYYIGDAEVRHLLYTRWTTLRKLKPHLSKIKEQVRENNTKLRLVYGQHDRIILASVGERFIKGIEDQSTLTIIPSGHQVLHEKHAEAIIEALLR